MTIRKSWIIIGTMLGAMLFSFASVPVQAQTTLPATIIDDFNDGDSSDWGFFGGNAAGGGGGAEADRPQEGTHYLSTGWGGQGTASGFYGGGFKNFDNAGQVGLPADAWFNVWVYNQSDATSDGYTLEMTIREDLDGNGWTDGAEDSFRLDTAFTSADYNDEWTLLSAPVSSFTNLNTGGDGTFNGNLDEIVIVIAGVTGGDPSTVELDFDQFSFTSGGPIVSPEPTVTVIDDFNDGDSSDWGFFGGNAAGGGGGAEADRPQEGTHYLSTGWGGQGTASGFYGGGFKNFDDAGQVVLPADAWFNVWVYNQSDATSDGYTLEMTIREDLDGNGWTDGAEDSFRLDTAFTSADYNDEWTLLSAPVSSFANLNTGGDGTFDGNLDEIVIVIAGVMGVDPSTVELDFDQFSFTSGGPIVPPEPPAPTQIVDDFENGLPTGVVADTDPAVPIGFFIVADGGSTASIDTTDAPPAPVPDSGPGNNVIAFTADVTAFAVFIHSFENPAVDSWVTQDWSSFGGLRFWFYGQNSGTTIFVDAIDNRNPDSTADDAERYSVTFIDDFSGWQLVELPFSTFTRKEIGNGAPNDGFNLTQVHGWALGALETSGEQTFYVDDAELYGEAVIPDLSVTFASSRFNIEEGTTGDVTVKLNRSLNSDDPAQVSVDYTTFPGVAIPGREYTPTSGTLTFVNGGPSELTFAVETFDDTKWEGDERIGLSLTNPVDVATGFATQASAFIMENDELDTNLIDDFSYGPYLYEGNSEITTKEIEAGDADAIPGQDAFETVLNVTAAEGGETSRDALAQIAVDLADLLPTNKNHLDNKINAAIAFINQIDNDDYWENDNIPDKRKGLNVYRNSAKAAYRLRLVVIHRQASDELKAEAQAAIDQIVAIDSAMTHQMLDLAKANDGSASWIRQAERSIARAERHIGRNNAYSALFEYGYAWRAARRAIFRMDLSGISAGAVTEFSREFPDAEDWSAAESMSFWYYGQNSGDAVTVELLDNRAADPGPASWEMVWAEEFNEPAGTTPNPDYWTYEIGDVTPDGKNGWGNDERQYYTDDAANAATDGEGNMVLTVREDTSGRDCYYGECEYTSARLISWRKAEFAYGRIESRIKVPPGEGIWPAFWSLGTDIDVVSWPQTGEIDFMEFVGRLPNEIFGTIHGPGYAGGASFGNIYTFDEPVYNDYHTFAVEWEPDLIKWYVDGILYHTATPADVAPNEWVFNDEVFLLLNVAIGGNFGGAIDPNIELPASMAVDYIRVYQGPDTAERFETTFTDDFNGWQEVTVPFDGFTRSAEQPAGAPDDGLTLTGVRGFGFKVPAGDGTAVMIDQVHIDPIPLPSEVTVTTLADSGEGSLRAAIAGTATDGTVTFDPSLAGGTITLTSGQLVIDRSVTIDGSGAAGLTVSGNNTSRVFTVNAPATVSMNDLTVSDGVGSPQGGGILNGGVLNLDAMVITNNTESSAGPADFQFGGGGIYNGDGATLNLTDSTVSNNSTLNQPGGGIYGFFNSTINVTNSTISGNVSGDVAGGFRTLGDVTVVNSTISGNVSTGWHGGGMFSTDGTVTILNTTITGNTGPDGTAGGLMIASFGAPVNATIQNSIIADNGTYGCQIEGGAASLSSLGNNVSSDPSCALDASDLDVGASGAGLGVLAGNGGPTLTHALEAGSPAIDAANGAACPATDQRGIARPQGAGCDVGAFEAN